MVMFSILWLIFMIVMVLLYSFIKKLELHRLEDTAILATELLKKGKERQIPWTTSTLIEEVSVIGDELNIEEDIQDEFIEDWLELEK